jgi:hypothetical protein
MTAQVSPAKTISNQRFGNRYRDGEQDARHDAEQATDCHSDTCSDN